MDALAKQDNWVVDNSFLRRVLDEGFVKGHNEGEINILQHQLTHKFGKLPYWAKLRLKTAQPEQLLSWSLNLLNAECLEQVFI